MIVKLNAYINNYQEKMTRQLELENICMRKLKDGIKIRRIIKMK